MKRVTAHGKEILLDGRHIADAVNEATAKALCIALNRVQGARGLHDSIMPLHEKTLLSEFFA